MMRAIRPYFNQNTMIDFYYSFLYPNMLYGIEIWGHASDTNLKWVLTMQKATVRVILNTSFFKIIEIMPVINWTRSTYLHISNIITVSISQLVENLIIDNTEQKPK